MLVSSEKVHLFASSWLHLLGLGLFWRVYTERGTFQSWPEHLTIVLLRKKEHLLCKLHSHKCTASCKSFSKRVGSIRLVAAGHWEKFNVTNIVSVQETLRCRNDSPLATIESQETLGQNFPKNRQWTFCQVFKVKTIRKLVLWSKKTEKSMSRAWFSFSWVVNLQKFIKILDYILQVKFLSVFVINFF